MDATDLPPAPVLPTAESDVVLRPSYRRLFVGGVAGALACSAVAVLVALQLAKPDIPVETAATRPSEPGEQLPAVEGLRAKEPHWTADPETWRVTLAWEAVEGAERYLVSRDGRRLNVVRTPGYEDGSVTPDKRYRYQVQAVGSDGERSEAATTRIRTAVLPKSAARVQGRWLLTLKVQSSNIGVGGGRLVVDFSPTCGQGPCDVGWDFTKVSNTGTAQQKGAEYEGTGSGSFLTLGCHGETISSTVTIQFHVDKARTLGSAWRATTISGTVSEFVPSFSNCLSTRNVWTFRGAAQG